MIIVKNLVSDFTNLTNFFNKVKLMGRNSKSKRTKIDRDKETEVRKFYGNKWVIILFIFFVSGIVYYNSLRIPFLLDDNSKIINNPDIKKLGNIKTKLIYPYDKEHATLRRNDPSRPLTYLTFTLNYYFGKLNPFGYHLINVILHIFNVICVFFLSRKIIYYTDKKDFILLPSLAALLFAIHPVNTVVVSYIFNRSDLLNTLFFVLSLLFFIKTFEKAKKYYILSLLCFIFSLSSKQIAVTLPAIILVFDYTFLSNFEIKNVVSKKHYHLVFWLVLAGYFLFRYLYLGGIGDLEAKETESWFSYFSTQPYVILKYLRLLFIPIGLCFEHGIDYSRTIFEFRSFVSFLTIFIIFTVTYGIYRKKRGISKIVLFSVLWFFITLSPTSSFFSTTAAMAENRLYLPGIGFYSLVIYLLLSFRSKVSRRFVYWILFGIIGTYILFLSIKTIRRNRLLENPILLWQDVISKNPYHFRAHNNLALLFFERKEYDKAIYEYEKALEVNPDYLTSRVNLASLYYEQKKYNEAMEEYKKILQIEPTNVAVLNNLGNLYSDSGKYDEAIKKYKKALEINPNHVEVHNNLAILYVELKEYTKAIEEYKKALYQDPDNTVIQNNLKNLYDCLNLPFEGQPN